MRQILLSTCVLVSFLILSFSRLGNARQCYACLNVTPTFDYMNEVKSEAVYSSCYFHTNITCKPPMNKCYVEVIRMEDTSTIDKGCANETEANKCSPYKPTGQRCVCAKMFCNADIELAGGTYFEGLITGEQDEDSSAKRTRLPSPGVICSMVAFLLMFFNCIHYSAQIMCCEGVIELMKKVDGKPRPCANTGTDCTNIGCEKNACDPIHDFHNPDSCYNVSCEAAASMHDYEEEDTTLYACRILYYEATSAEGDESTGISLDSKQYAKQECFVLGSDEDIKMGCYFSPKIFYLDKNLRITQTKDCYCCKDFCNMNLVNTCAALHDSIKGKEDTCSKSPQMRWNVSGTISLMIAIACYYFKETMYGY